MYIQSFHMDGFGIFSDVSVENLSPGLSIFLGENEAGKSTCLEFLRTMLIGYPDPRNKEYKRIPGPLRGGQPGGSMELRSDERGILRLTRRPGSNGGVLTLTDPEGKPLEPDMLRQMLSGVSRDVYRNVFGFSLTELEDLSSLTDEGVRNALYGASFGPGLRSPGEALKLLDKQADEIFKSGGSKPALNAALRQLAELRQRKIELEQECAGYDSMAMDLAAKRDDLANLRHRKLQLEEERRILERRLGVWLQWNEWRMAGARLERLDPISATFPENGRERLARAQEAREGCERQWAAQMEKLTRLRQRRDELEINYPLLEALPALRRMAERKSGFRQALSALPAQEEALLRAQEDLSRELSRLGPDWSCDRIRATDRSLFAREDIERQGREMRAAASAHQAAVDSLTQSNREVESAEREVASNTAALDLLPAPPAALDDDARDNLRQALARQEEARRQRPLRQRAVNEAKTTFSRAFNPLRLVVNGASDGAQAEALLDSLLSRQEEALVLAADVQEKMHQADDAAQDVRQAEEQVAAVKGRVEALREEQRHINGPTREDLDGQTLALRKLRALSATLGTERERLEELSARIGNEPPVTRVKNLPLLVLGLAFFLGGAGMLLAYWRMGITSIALTADIELPVSLWSGYLLLLCGVGFMAGGVPHTGAEAKRRQMEHLQLQGRRDSCAAHVAELDEQASQLCAAAGVQSMDLVTLEAREVLLEHEREQCFEEERARKDMDELKHAMDLARTEVSKRQAVRSEVEGIVQQTRRRWHEFMLALHVANVPSPEGAAAFFARAESARLAFGGVAAADAELQTLDDDLRQTEARMRLVPAVAERLPANADSDSLAEAVRQVLESCREADAARELRIKAEAALQNSQSELNRARTRQAEASAELRQAQERLNEARSQWTACLHDLGLGTDLDPETVREALKYMENCLAAEASVQRAQSQLTQGRTELAALRDPLQALLAELGLPPQQDADNRPDWLLSLDAALEAAEAMSQAQSRRRNLDNEVTEMEDEARAAEAALESARSAERSLLAMAGAHDAEEFLRQAALHEELRALTLRRQDLEDALRLAADKTPMKEFLDSFEHEDQESQERRSATISEELTGIQEQEENLVKRVAELRSKVDALSRTDELSQLLQQEAALVEDMERMAFAWSRVALARSILETAKRTFELERQPEVIRLASSIFTRITGQRWRGINASLEDASLAILPAQGEPIAPENLSRGAREQAYLALRLAYIKNHALHAAPLPVIMDEVLVNFDPQRAERTARAFVELTGGSQGKAHQLLYFTCQPHMAELLRKAEPQAALFHVQDGSIKAA
ncbi:AAA family ATPase [Desulfovibrio sp.]|uniref:AAA family ATPase n=1 Tax=Desulfovibrio sp. TaxID=885 RepID=UPI0025B7F06E|nr:AAA family ATPase [Desulfovibrio sp.]